MAKSLQPLADRVLVRPLKAEEVRASGIVIPDTAKEKPQEGEILAIGPGKLDDNGKRVTMEVKVGDRVLYSKYGGDEFTIDNEELKILSESDILAIVKK